MSFDEERISVGLSSCGIAAGADEVFAVLKYAKRVGCIGLCWLEPLVCVKKDGKSVYYKNVDRKRAEKIAEGEAELDWEVDVEQFLKKQNRIVLRNCGMIDPESIDEYIEVGGYSALKRARSMKPEEIIAQIEESGLRGRGGAGFATGLKWRLCRKNPPPRYIICNADEGDPGAFMDRAVLEGDPHSVIEGMLIGALAIGAERGYIYIRAEYPLAVKRLKIAISQAEERGFLDSFSIKIKEGAGAFVCGEETALIASVEGKRGMPRKRPPFPAERGLFGRPTNINNVETWANVPWIVNNGSDAFSNIGTEGSAGTKVFCIAGKAKRTGLVEVPMGMTLREIIFELAGGIEGDKRFKAVQIGGPSGGCLPEELLDTEIDYDSLGKAGAIMGSGGMVIMDEATCMVDVAKFFLSFTQAESCGKCTFCRIGTKRMLEILERITGGEGREEDLVLLKDLAERVKETSLCGLGQTAPNPVLTTLRYFENEFYAHIEGRCPALSCKALITYSIDPDICSGCMLCAKRCPVSAIFGKKGEPHRIDQSLCTKCEICFDLCKEGAVICQ